MEEPEESRNSDLMQRLKPSTASSSSSVPIPKFQQPSRLDLPSPNSSSSSSSLGRGPYRYFPPSPDSSKRPAGIPPAHPQIPPAAARSPSPAAAAAAGPRSFSPVGPSHSRSLSQPAFFNLDSFPSFTPPPLDPSPPGDVAMDDRRAPPPSPATLVRTNSGSGRAAGDGGLPPRKVHRRSQSDIPFGFLQSPFPMAALPPLPQGFLDRSAIVKQESEWDRERDSGGAEGIGERKSDGDPAAVDDLFSAYMNLDSLDTLNSSGTEEKKEDLDSSRASGTKTNGGGADSSENEAESSVNESGNSLSGRGERKEGNKRSAAGDPGPVTLTSRHNRSISMDSFMGKLNFAEESPKVPPSPGGRVGQHSHSGSMDGTTSTFSLEFGNGEFSGAELKKIMANEKLAEIAMSDPKRAKRILANRQSAARSKERKMRYISELEHKVQTLQTEATTLSAQLTLLQRDSAGLTTQNNELKFRLQAMEQQARLRDALNEALTAEVQRLKLATGEAHLSSSLNQQLHINPQMFRLQQLQKHQQQQQQQQQQSPQIPHYQQQQQNSDGNKNESNK